MLSFSYQSCPSTSSQMSSNEDQTNKWKRLQTEEALFYQKIESNLNKPPENPWGTATPRDHQLLLDQTRQRLRSIRTTPSPPPRHGSRNLHIFSPSRSPSVQPTPMITAEMLAPLAESATNSFAENLRLICEKIVGEKVEAIIKQKQNPQFLSITESSFEKELRKLREELAAAKGAQLDSNIQAHHLKIEKIEQEYLKCQMMKERYQEDVKVENFGRRSISPLRADSYERHIQPRVKEPMTPEKESTPEHSSKKRKKSKKGHKKNKSRRDYSPAAKRHRSTSRNSPELLVRPLKPASSRYSLEKNSVNESLKRASSRHSSEKSAIESPTKSGKRQRQNSPHSSEGLKLSTEVAPKYLLFCPVCKIYLQSSRDFEAHILTEKHKRREEDQLKDSKMSKPIPKKFRPEQRWSCDICGIKIICSIESYNAVSIIF